MFCFVCLFHQANLIGEDSATASHNCLALEQSAFCFCNSPTKTRIGPLEFGLFWPLSSVLTTPYTLLLSPYEQFSLMNLTNLSHAYLIFAGSWDKCTGFHEVFTQLFHLTLQGANLTVKAGTGTKLCTSTQSSESQRWKPEAGSWPRVCSMKSSPTAIHKEVE